MGWNTKRNKIGAAHISSFGEATGKVLTSDGSGGSFWSSVEALTSDYADEAVDGQIDGSTTDFTTVIAFTVDRVWAELNGVRIENDGGVVRFLQLTETTFRIRPDGASAPLVGDYLRICGFTTE